MSTVFHRTSVSGHRIRCLSMPEDSRNFLCREARDLSETKATREYAKEKERMAAVQIAQENGEAHRLFLDREERMLKSLSLSHWESFWKNVK